MQKTEGVIQRSAKKTASTPNHMLLISAFVLAGIAVGCGSDSGTDDTGSAQESTTEQTTADETTTEQTTAEETTTTAATTDASTADEGATEAGEDAGAEGAEDGAGEDGSAEPAAGSADSPADGVEISAADGTATFMINPDWSESSYGGVPLWYVDESNGSTANVNVTSEPLSRAVSLQEYLDGSLKQVGSVPTLTVTSSGMIDGPNGELAYVRYEGTVPNVESDSLQFFSYLTVSETTGVVITLTTDSTEFDEVLEKVDPYLLTIQPAK